MRRAEARNASGIPDLRRIARYTDLDGTRPFPSSRLHRRASGCGRIGGVHQRHKLGLALGLTLGFVVAEAIAGYFSHSLALLSDAGHNFADAAALGFSWYALWIARKPANQGMTYGYHRVGILAAFVNAVSLAVIALLIVVEAIGRLRHPEPVRGGLMIAVAAVAVALNVVISLWLHAGAQHDINLRSAYLHMVGDAVSAVGVIVAGVVVVLSGAELADPMVAFLIAGLILWSSWGILTESVTVLLEGTPPGMDMCEVESCIRQVPGVIDVHDLHVWTVGPAPSPAASTSWSMSKPSARGSRFCASSSRTLQHRFQINHTTVQVEVEGHGSNEMYCCIEPRGTSHLGHGH